MVPLTQYEDGTTDVTRTMHLGTPTEAQRECFTRVLKGNIALDTAVFPENTPGFVLDVLARKSLWQAGMDYAHGTGVGESLTHWRAVKCTDLLLTLQNKQTNKQTNNRCMHEWMNE